MAARVLTEPKGAALEALARWRAGESAASVASERLKPIQAATVVGYIADALAHVRAGAGGRASVAGGGAAARVGAA